MATGDKSAGMLGALAEVFPDAMYQRCTVHFYRNVLAKVPARRRRMVAAQLKAIHAQESLAAGLRKAEEVAHELETSRLADAARVIREGVAETLRQQSVFGRRYDVHIQIDSTRESLLEAIDETFGGAREDDVSLFYINCHGDYDDTAWIELHDGTRVTAVQLEQLLRGIPGRVVVIVDCCRSGAFLGDSAAADRFTSAVCDAFRAGGAQSAFASGKYLVITSAGPDEDSYRRSFSNDSDEGSMATILARSLCEGAGWDIIGDKMCTLKADANRDRVVTLQEIWQYAHRRVLYYLEGTGVKQTVRVWPEGDQTALFGRA